MDPFRVKKIKKVEEDEIRIWKTKRLVKDIEKIKGAGTSMITLFIKPKTQVSQVQQMLQDELSSASHIKSRVNRQSVEDAIVCTKEKLKLFSKIPPNGLCLFCGLSVNDPSSSSVESTLQEVNESNSNSGGNSSNAKMQKIAIEPPKPIKRSLYKCDNRFHVEDLSSVLDETSEAYGFIVVDGQGVLYAKLRGSTREVLQKIPVNLPKKHSKGGQSSVRFARLRVEARHNYVRKVGETATVHFIDKETSLPNVKGLVLAGSADFKTVLSRSDLLDQRLKPLIVSVVDISYGSEFGLEQAITLSSDALSNVRYVKEKMIIDKFFNEVSKDSSMVCFGVKNTMNALNLGIIDSIICIDTIAQLRVVSKKVSTNSEGKETENEVVSFGTKEEIQLQIKNGDLKIVSAVPVVDWLAEFISTSSNKVTLHMLSDQSEIAKQFLNGFGGIGCFLKFKMDLTQFDTGEKEKKETEDDLDDFI